MCQSGGIISKRETISIRKITESEPNETRGTATRLTINQYCQGEIGSYQKYKMSGSTDIDYYAINLVAGNSYTFAMFDYIEEFSDTTLILHIYAPNGNGNVFLSSEMKRRGTNQYTFYAKETGTYYIQCYNYFDNRTKKDHNYEIIVYLPCKNLGYHTWDDGCIEGGLMKYCCYFCDAIKREEIPIDRSNHWEMFGDIAFWYENGIRQGTYDDPQGVLGDGTVRGREIYDPGSDGWYWLDACKDGAKAVSKEVWMPYIYQGEQNWPDAEIEMNANNSGDMKQQVIDCIKNRTGKWVRYDSNGKMYKGWYTVEGSDCSLYPTQVGNTYYYDYQTGLMAKGYVTIDDTLYHFDEVTGALDK